MNRTALVFAGGIVVSALGLIWAPDAVIIVSGAAALGYGGMARLLGVRPDRKLSQRLFATQVGVYLMFRWIEYAAAGGTGELGDFLAQFDTATRNLHFRNGAPAGGLGYLSRAVEVAFFAASGVLGVSAASEGAYCESCVRYMRTRQLGVIAAIEDAGLERAKEQLADLQRLAMAGDGANFRRRLKEADPEGALVVRDPDAPSAPVRTRARAMHALRGGRAPRDAVDELRAPVEFRWTRADCAAPRLRPETPLARAAHRVPRDPPPQAPVRLRDDQHVGHEAARAAAARGEGEREIDDARAVEAARESRAGRELAARARAATVRCRARARVGPDLVERVGEQRRPSRARAGCLRR